MTKKILLVDDEPHVLRVMKLSLGKDGYEVDTAPNGQVALEKLRESHPDILITDIDMPKMTGEELCKHIEQEFPDRTFIIFVATSRAEVEHREWSRGIRDLNFMEKPLSIRKVQAMLREHFENSGA